MSTPPPAPVFTKPALPEGLAALLTFAFVAVLIRTAWMSDDAMITLRTILNVMHGFGLRYNIAERVQTFTHPLWLGIVTAMYYVTSNVYYAAFAASILLSAAAFWIGVTRAVSGWQAAVVAVILFFSRAFVDFSTSGLENPLSYALLAVFLGVFLASEREADYRRLIPAGYQETLETGENRLKDRGLHEYYHHLTAVTGDRIWASARLKEIVALNRRKYDRLIDRTFYRYSSVAALNELAIRRPDGTLPGDATVRTLAQPLAVLAADRGGATRIDIALDSDDQYPLTFIGRGAGAQHGRGGPDSATPPRARPGELRGRDPATRQRARVRHPLISPVAGDRKYAIGHVLFH